MVYTSSPASISRLKAAAPIRLIECGVVSPKNSGSGSPREGKESSSESPLCQVGVTPHSPGGIEPSSLVNSPPGQVGAMPSHPINPPLGLHEVASSVSP